jgi:proteasome lid subunit RPN8/RPN11
MLISSGVGQTLVQGYRNHLNQERGDEETGWLLMGYREKKHAVVVAAVPSGEFREASSTHVKFNSQAQVVAGRLLRQLHDKLEVLGLFHTHPGRLRHPSSGDYQGDIQWVKKLPGKQGVFGIGTVDHESPIRGEFATKIAINTFSMTGMRFDWFSLASGDSNYVKVPIRWTLGEDLAKPLHVVWDAMEIHAGEIEKVLAQQAKATCGITQGAAGHQLTLSIPLAGSAGKIIVFIFKDKVQYFFEKNEQLFAVDIQEDKVDRGVYLVLAELSK